MSPEHSASPHRIRLPAPWRATRSPAAAPASVASVVFLRSFQRPTGLTGQSTVRLEVKLLEPLTFAVALNGSACTVAQRSELVFAVSLDPAQLKPVNELEITFSLPSGADASETPRFGQDYISQVELLLW